MKLIIAGSRKLLNRRSIHEKFIESTCYDFFEIFPTEIVSGNSGIADWSGEKFAWIQNLQIKKFPADWNKHGKAAGPIRNREMAEYSDALLLIWDGTSRGSANMKKEMNKLDKPVYEVILKNPGEL